MYQIVIDTNVFISALRSKRGASYKLLFDADRGKFHQNISTPLILEYESVAKRNLSTISLTTDDIDAVLDVLCKNSNERTVSYRWRPHLKDPKDDFILELAIDSQCEYIITYNKSDFAGAEEFAIGIITPKEFLEIIGEI